MKIDRCLSKKPVERIFDNQTIFLSLIISPVQQYSVVIFGRPVANVSRFALPKGYKWANESRMKSKTDLTGEISCINM